MGEFGCHGCRERHQTLQARWTLSRTLKVDEGSARLQDGAWLGGVTGDSARVQFRSKEMPLKRTDDSRQNRRVTGLGGTGCSGPR